MATKTGYAPQSIITIRLFALNSSNILTQGAALEPPLANFVAPAASGELERAGKLKAQYYTCCVNSTAAKIDDMVERAREITYKTFIANVDIDVESFGYVRRGRGLKLKDDWAVSYYKSRYAGRKCYYMCHSCIEYIYI